MKHFILFFLCIGFNAYLFSQCDFQYVGSPGFSSTGLDNGSASAFAFGSSGVPYVLANEPNEALMFKRLEGGNWVPVLTSGVFIPEDAIGYQRSLLYDSQIDRLYVAYSHLTSTFERQLKVFYLNAGSLVQVGGVLDNIVYDIDMKIHPVTGELYVAYSKEVSGGVGRPNVKRFDGSSWVSVGAGDIVESSARHINLVFDSLDQPVVAFSEADEDWAISTYIFNGADWLPLGPTGFAEDFVEDIVLLFDDQSNQLRLAYSKIPGNTNLMRFDGFIWVFLGAPGQLAQSSGFDMAQSQNGDLWLVSNDSPAGMLFRFNDVDLVWQAHAASTPSEKPRVQFDAAGDIYIALTDLVFNERVSVLKFPCLSFVDEIAPGCTYDWSPNFDPQANVDDGSCENPCSCPGDLDGNGLINSGDLGALLQSFGQTCILMN